MNIRDEFAFSALAMIKGNTVEIKVITTQEENDEAVQDALETARGAYLWADVMLQAREEEL
jgi:hypothetical protein